MWEKEKKEVLKATLECYEKGLFAGTSGNLSLYDSKRKLLIITPSGVPYEGMTADDMVVCDLDGKTIEGKHKPSSEWALHAAIYLARPEFKAVVHTHSPYATSFAAAGQKIPLVLIEMLPFLGGDIKVGKYAINGSKEVADYTVMALQDRKAALMANHGAVAAGASLQDAVTSAIYLEDAAKICSLARLHGNVQEISSPADKHSSMENDAKKYNNMPPSVSMADYSAYNIDSIDMTGHNINDIDTVYLDDKTSSMVLIDQTLLPNQTKIISLRNQKDIWRAINILQVRGAPAIGVAAAIGIYLAAKEIYEKNTTMEYADFFDKFEKAKDYLNSSRPTAVNLSWALRRMESIVTANQDKPVKRIIELLHDECIQIHDEDVNVCKAIGEYGLSLVNPGDGLLTHCNAGKLCAIKYGTATAPIYLGHERGYNFRVFADETRPLLQGARLTAFELQSAGVDVTLICDNMSASVMKKGLVNAIFVGADRIAANGDAANKIGTSMVALAAKRYNIPFYVCAPTSTIDMATPTGSDITIEERDPAEVTSMWYEKPMAPEDVKVYNPAFDVTDADLITAIVTEEGIIYPPYKKNLATLMTR